MTTSSKGLVVISLDFRIPDVGATKWKKQEVNRSDLNGKSHGSFGLQLLNPENPEVVVKDLEIRKPGHLYHSQRNVTNVNTTNPDKASTY